MPRVVVRDDNTIAVIYPAPGHTEQEIQDGHPDLVGRPFVDQASPPDPDGLGRTFRDAWRFQGGVVVHDLVAAKAIKARALAAERVERDKRGERKELTEAPGAARTPWSNYRRQVAGVDLDVSKFTTAVDLANFTPDWPVEPT